MWILPLYLHINKKSDNDEEDDDDDEKVFFIKRFFLIMFRMFKWIRSIYK